MTKQELLAKLQEVPDGAVIYVYDDENVEYLPSESLSLCWAKNKGPGFLRALDQRGGVVDAFEVWVIK